MSIYLWGTLIVVFFVGVVVWMRKEQGGFQRLLREQAARRGGQVTAPTVFRYSELSFVAENTQFTVSAMPNSGATGHPGEFTYVDFFVEQPLSISFHLQTRNRSVQRLIDGLGKPHQLKIDNAQFDKTFRLYSNNPGEIKSLFTHDLQTALLAVDQSLEIQFDGTRFILTNDKIVKTAQECDEVVEIGILFSVLLVAE